MYITNQSAIVRYNFNNELPLLPKARLMNLTRFISVAITCSALFFNTNLHASATLPEINFTKKQQHAVIEILSKLRDKHYNDQPFNDDTSREFFHSYIKSLDPAKSFFTQEDIKQFSKYETRLDNMLWDGNLTAGQEIYHLFREKATQRLSKVLATIKDEKTTFNFSAKETLVIDRDELDYVKSSKALDERWRKRIKNSVLNLKMAGKTIPEAKETLARRYKNQLDQIRQQDSEDAFAVFVNSLTELYDPHTSYLSPRTMENFKISMSLSLEGIGAVLKREDEFTKVVRLVPAGPADRQGDLKPADIITAVGQGQHGPMVDVVGWRLDEVVKLIRGPKDSLVRLEVKHSKDTETEIVPIKRGTVKLEEQSAQKTILEVPSNTPELPYRVGVISIPAFYMDFDAYRNGDPNFRSTTRDVYKILKELESENIDGVIIDLRNNGGGSLKEATTLTDLFIDQGPVVQIRHSDETISRRSRSYREATYRGPLMVLINRLSASASEIFAGAIQDYGRGLIVGSQSFGKGTVQAVTPLNQGSLKLTESKFYRVSGDSTQHQGVIPDIELPSFISNEDVGESSYETALPWDSIQPAPHRSYFTMTDFVAPLTVKHIQRTQTNPDLIYLLKQIEITQKTRDRKEVSLNEKIRKSNKDAIDIELLVTENARRQAKKMPLLKSLDELKDENEDKEESESLADNEKNTDDDIILNESGRILIDFISLLEKKDPHRVASFVPCFFCDNN